MVDQDEPQDCIICVCKNLRFVWVLLMCMAESSCPHQDRTSTKIFWKLSFRSKLPCMVMCCCYLLTITRVSYELKYGLDDYQSGFEILIPLANSLLGLGMSTSFLARNNSFILYYNGFAKLFLKRSSFGFDRLVNWKIVWMFRKVTQVSYALIMVILLRFGYCVFNGDWFNLVMELGTTSCYLQLVSLFSAMVCAFTCYRELLLACYGDIIIKLTHFKSEKLQENLQVLQRFYLAIVRNFEQHILSPFNPFAVTGLLLYTVYLMIHSYLYYAQFNLRRMHMTDLKPIFQLMGFCLGSINFCVISEHIHTLSNDLISFLFKYPTHQLSRSEAYQVESVLVVVVNKKPTLRPCNFFTISPTVFASNCGAALTYGLVAIQLLQ